jgi:hypothetical protein
MRYWFYIEVLRRVLLVAGVLAGGAALFQGKHFVIGAISIASGILAYIFLPKEKLPSTSEHMSYGEGVIGVDVGASVLALPLLALVYSLIGNDGMPRWWMVFIFTSPMIVAGLVLYWMATRNACLWLSLDSGHVKLADIKTVHEFHLSQVVEARPHVFKMPNWGWALLAAFGGPRGVGMAILHGGRKAEYLNLKLKDGTEIILPKDGFPAVSVLEEQLQPVSI